MIKKVDMFTLICDNCGVDFLEGEDFSCWNDAGFVTDSADESGWLIEDGKHYCNDCYSYNDNDELVLKRIGPKVDKP